MSSPADQVAPHRYPPPLRGGRWSADSLPKPLTTLIGREREVAIALAMLRRPDVRLLTLTGTGGIGKTRLSLEVARAVVGFQDGARFVPLAAVSEPGAVPAAIAHALGIRESAEVPARDALILSLSGAELLLVLDNFEHIVAAAPLVTDLLTSCPCLKILVTSRMLLRVNGEYAFPVPPLSLGQDVDSPVTPEAVRLFVERARAISPSFTLNDETAPLATEICRHLDGLPLAIELAAARTRHMPLPMLRERLERRLPVLTDGPRDAPLRLRTMQDAIAWSYDLLTPEAKGVFRRVAVFVGGFTLEAGEAVAGQGGEESPSVLPCIAALVEASLLRAELDARGTTRYLMLETVREFAAGRLAAAGETAEVRRRHAELFVARAEAGIPYMRGPSESEWFDRLDADSENVRAAVAWADEHGETALGLRLVTAVHMTWHARGRVTELRLWLDRLIAAPGVDMVSPAIRSAAHVVSVWAAVTQSDHRRAVGFAEDAIRYAQLAADPVLIARATLMLGLAYQGFDLEKARTYQEEAVALSRGLDDPALLPAALGNVGEVLRRLGEYSAAAELVDEQASLERARGYRRGLARALVDFGDLDLVQDNSTAAAVHYRQAMKEFHAAGDVTYLSFCLTGIALAAAKESPLAASRLFGAAEALRDRIGLTMAWLGEQRYGEAIARVRGALGEEAFAATWAAGRALELDDAVAEALSPSEPEPHARAAWANLTRREDDVLRLLVSGKTGREIAAALVLSVRTVESHVRHILAKLGVPSRTAAVATAIAAELVKPTVPGQSDRV